MNNSSQRDRARPQAISLSESAGPNTLKSALRSSIRSPSRDWAAAIRGVTSPTMKKDSPVEKTTENKQSLGKGTLKGNFAEKVKEVKVKIDLEKAKREDNYISPRPNRALAQEYYNSTNNSKTGTPKMALGSNPYLLYQYVAEKAQTQPSPVNLNDKVASLTQELESSTQSISEKDIEIGELKVSLILNLEKMHRQETELNQVKKSLNAETSLRETCDKISANLVEREKEIEVLKETMEKLRGEHSKALMQAQREEVEKVKRLEEKAMELEEQVKRLETDLVSHSGNSEVVEKKEKEIRELRKQMEEKEREIEKMREVKRGLEEQVKKVTGSAEEVVRKSEERLKMETEQLKEVIVRLEGEVKEYKGVKSQLEVSENEKKEILRKQNVLKDELVNVRKKDEEVNREKDELRSKLEEVERELERERADNKKRSLGQSGEVESLKEEIKRIKQEKLDQGEAKNRLIAEQSRQIEDLKAKYEHLSKESSIDKQELENKETRIKQEAAEKIGSLESEKSELINKLEQAESLVRSNLTDSQAKEQYIQALINDVNQMREFILERHGESVFEKEGEDAEAKEEVQIIERVREEEKINKKARCTTEQTSTRSSNASIYESNSNIEWVDRPSSKPSADYTIEAPVNNKPVEKEKSALKSNGKKTVSRVSKQNKVEIVKLEVVARESKIDKKIREEDPVYRQLEKMIKELNEKVMSNEKKAKKVYEEKMEEVMKESAEREMMLLVEIEKLKNEKRELLKKIDDIDWDKAYEHTMKMKAEKQQEEKALEVINKMKQIALDASKKKKKK